MFNKQVLVKPTKYHKTQFYVLFSFFQLDMKMGSFMWKKGLKAKREKKKEKEQSKIFLWNIFHMDKSRKAIRFGHRSQCIFVWMAAVQYQIFLYYAHCL